MVARLTLHSTLVTSVTLCLFLAGCQGTGARSGGNLILSKLRKSDDAQTESIAVPKATVPQEEESVIHVAHKLKNPAKLHLTYARWQEQLGNLIVARENYEKALGENNKSVDAVLGLARINHLSDRKLEAEQGFQKALRMAPNNPDALDAIGQFYISQDQLDKGTDYLKQAVLAAPTDDTYRFNLAVAYARKGEIESARSHFMQTVGNAEAHYNLGYILFEDGKLAQAKREFQQAVMKKPDLQKAQLMLEEVRLEEEEQVMLAGAVQPEQQAFAAPGAQTQYAHQTASNRSLFANDPVAQQMRRNQKDSGIARPNGTHTPPEYVQRPVVTGTVTTTHLPATPQSEQMQNQRP